MSAQERWEVAEWRRRTCWPRRPLPAPKVHSPRLRRDQIKALFYLKRFEGRPMTKLAQEAVDRYLAAHGGVEGLIERGLAAFGDPGRGGAAAARRALTAITVGRRRRAGRLPPAPVDRPPAPPSAEPTAHRLGSGSWSPHFDHEWRMRARGRPARFRGNVPAAGLRRREGGDAARCERPAWFERQGARCRPPHAHDPARPAPRPGPPRRRLPLPGCGLKFCDAHHVEHRADGGATKLDNLIQLCRRHHRAVHEEGFTVELLAGGEARFRRPTGLVIEEAPALPAVCGDAAARLVRRLARQSIRVDAADSLPSWEGGPADYNWTIQHLRRLVAEVA